MPKYIASYEFEAESPEAAAQKVLSSLYVGDIDAGVVKIAQQDGTEVFKYPLVQSLIRQLNEEGRN